MNRVARSSHATEFHLRYVLILMISMAAVSCLSGCARKVDVRAPYTEQTGQASWYGEKFHNRRTASGEVFDMNKYTAAHRTLPFDTMVRVENLKNGKRIDVRINDRGPFVEGRIIDLSRKAAETLGMIRDGVVPVRIRVLN